VAATRPAQFHLDSRTRVLANGLRVVVHPDHASPILAVNLMYHVGSGNEPPGRTGLAHLLEHLLFEGTENCPKGEFDLLLEHVGGTNNGSTWLDRTNFYETVPTHAAELALWLERERLAHFLPLLDDEMLELQRDVVINERLQTSENRPYGLADERLYSLLFADGHPYSWPTIGWMQDLERISREDVRRFFQAYFTPANATLVLAGDIEVERGFEMAERYLGDLAGTPPPLRTVSAAAGNGRPARDILPDRVTFPRLYLAHSTPPYGSRDWNSLDVLAYVLADGESSRLQRALVREAQVAQEVDTYLLPTELAGVFGIVATARSGVEAEAIEDRVRAELRRLVEGGVERDELEGAVRRVRRDQLAGLANVEDRAEALAHAATVLGDAEALNSVLDGYLQVTPEDVVRVADEFLLRSGGAVLSVVPGEDADERG
jgi:zinc protease